MRLNIAWRCIYHILLKYLMGNYSCGIVFSSLTVFIVAYFRYCLFRYQVKVVPILVGALSSEKEAFYGRMLARYVDDPNNFFSVSSDFCHWGSRYFYSLLSLYPLGNFLSFCFLGSVSSNLVSFAVIIHLGCI